MNPILQQIQHHAAALPISSQAELLNYAVYLEQKAREKTPITLNQVRREGLAQALAQAVALNPFAEIADPVVWQREQRQDSNLSSQPLEINHHVNINCRNITRDCRPIPCG